MITLFEDYTDDKQISQYQKDRVQDVTFENGIYPKRMMVFENYWEDSCFNNLNNQSCKPFLENISFLIGEEVHVGHRYIQSIHDLRYYLKDPGGAIWDHPEIFSVAYFGMHGSEKGFPMSQGLIRKNQILQLCKGFGRFPNILYFGSCSIFKDDDQFGYDLLSTGTLGVLGFKEDVPFSLGMLIDLCFLSILFLEKTFDPLQNLEMIFNRVIEEIPATKDLGFTLYC